VHRFKANAVGLTRSATVGYAFVECQQSQGDSLKNNYVLIDYENVQPKSLSLLDAHDVQVIVFVGANQAKIPFELALAIQELGEKAKYVKIAGNGPNALDFHIAFYMGQIAQRDSDAYFHIISKDTGFDPLIKHLREKKMFAQREKSLAEIPLLRTSSAVSSEEKIKAVVERLSSMGNARPRKLKTLTSTVHALFFKQLDDADLSAIIDQMKRRELVKIDGEKVMYMPPISHG
jgi:hypothetical protein